MKRRKSKIRPDVFLHAAELIYFGRTRYACHAIEIAAYGDLAIQRRGSAEFSLFAGLFEKDAIGFGGAPDGVWFLRGGDMTFDRVSRERIFALLFARELALDRKHPSRRPHWPLHRGQLIRGSDEWRSFDGSWRTVASTNGPRYGERYNPDRHAPHRRPVGTKGSE
jgi:hypothetical protein